MERINSFLDKFILPWPVRYLSHRFVILITIALLIPLLVYSNYTTLVLLVNSYLNTMSVAVSSIVLLYATVSEIHQKQIAEMQEQRAQEDHAHVVEMHQLMQVSLANQQQELDELKAMLAAAQGHSYQRKSPAAVPDLKAMHRRGAGRFEPVAGRVRHHLHQHGTLDQVQKGLTKAN